VVALCAGSAGSSSSRNLPTTRITVDAAGCSGMPELTVARIPRLRSVAIAWRVTWRLSAFVLCALIASPTAIIVATGRRTRKGRGGASVRNSADRSERTRYVPVYSSRISPALVSAAGRASPIRRSRAGICRTASSGLAASAMAAKAMTATADSSGSGSGHAPRSLTEAGGGSASKRLRVLAVTPMLIRADSTMKPASSGIEPSGAVAATRSMRQMLRAASRCPLRSWSRRRPCVAPVTSR
jgi:hypothetical protein